MLERASGLNILFVCTGNTCRSPMAEGVLRAQVALWGIGDRVLIDSAGTTRWHESQPPTPEAQVAARERGYFINELRSRPVEASDFDRFDWIIGMTREHQQFLRERRRSHDQAQILLITAFSTNPEFREIADPFSQGQEAYDLALDQILIGVQLILLL